MRTSNFRQALIITASSLLWIVEAQDLGSSNFGPSSIGISPPVLAAGQPYTVTWVGCTTPQCTVDRATLIASPSPDGQTTATQIITFQPLDNTCETSLEGAATSCMTSIAPPLQTDYIYEIDLAWRGIDGLSHTTGSPLPVQLTAGGTASVGSGSATNTADVPVLPTAITSQSTSTPSATSPTIAATSSSPPPTSSPSPTITGIANISSSGSSGLSTGAKVGIAIGAVGFALIVLIAALLLWRRSRQRQLRALPNGTPYSHETGSMPRDLMAEKEMHVINSPVDTLQTNNNNVYTPVDGLHTNGYTSIPPVTAAAAAVASAPSQRHSVRSSWPQPSAANDYAAARGADGGAGAAVPYSDTPYGKTAYEDAHAPSSPAHDGLAPSGGAGAAIQRKPVGTTGTGGSGAATQHLREPGMSDEEVARLEEEERRLDEAIAEAERRRQG